MGFSRQEYWSGLPFPSPGDLPDPGIKLRPPALQADSLLTDLQGQPLADVSFIYIMDKQQGLTVEHRELYSIAYDKP